jgi:hypothetical protein
MALDIGWGYAGQEFDDLNDAEVGAVLEALLGELMVLRRLVYEQAFRNGPVVTRGDAPDTYIQLNVAIDYVRRLLGLLRQFNLRPSPAQLLRLCAFLHNALVDGLFNAADLVEGGFALVDLAGAAIGVTFPPLLHLLLAIAVLLDLLACRDLAAKLKKLVAAALAQLPQPA